MSEQTQALLALAYLAGDIPPQRPAAGTRATC